MESAENQSASNSAERLSPIEKILNGVAGNVLGDSNIRSVYGEPVRDEQRTIIPVARVSYRFGFGGGSGSSASPADPPASGGGGGGGTLSARPVGYIETTPNGSRFVPIIDWSQILLTTATMGAVIAVLAVLRRKPSAMSNKHR